MKLFFTSQDGCLNPPGENKKGADTAGNSGCAPKRRDKLAKTPRQINRETHRNKTRSQTRGDKKSKRGSLC